MLRGAHAARRSRKRSTVGPLGLPIAGPHGSCKANRLAKFNLQPNEVVLLKDDSVMHGGLFSAYTDELILTNLNFVPGTSSRRGTIGCADMRSPQTSCESKSLRTRADRREIVGTPWSERRGTLKCPRSPGAWRAIEQGARPTRPWPSITYGAVMLAMTDRTFALWLTIATILGTGAATFVAFIGGAAIVARQYRREREHHSALAVLAALTKLDQFGPFMTVNFELDGGRPRNPLFAATLGRVGREVRDALPAIASEHGPAPDALMAAVRELWPVAVGLRDIAERLSDVDYPDPQVRPADAALGLARRVQQIDDGVRTWLKSDVGWWRRTPLRLPPADPKDSKWIADFMTALEATYYRGEPTPDHATDDEKSGPPTE